MTVPLSGNSASKTRILPRKGRRSCTKTIPPRSSRTSTRRCLVFSTDGTWTWAKRARGAAAHPPRPPVADSSTAPNSKLPSSLRGMMLDILLILSGSSAQVKIMNDTLVRWMELAAMGRSFPQEFEDLKSFLTEVSACRLLFFNGKLKVGRIGVHLMLADYLDELRVPGVSDPDH